MTKAKKEKKVVFTKEAIYWGTDTGSVDLAGVYRWDRTTKELARIHRSEGAILFGTKLDNGTIVFSTDREGFPNEKDLRTRLIIIKKDGDISEIDCGTWNIWKKGRRGIVLF